MAGSRLKERPGVSLAAADVRDSHNRISRVRLLAQLQRAKLLFSRQPRRYYRTISERKVRRRCWLTEAPAVVWANRATTKRDASEA